MRRLRQHERSVDRSVCYCDECATVTKCDISYRIAAARQRALAHGVGRRPTF
jgi:hypothetical protein